LLWFNQLAALTRLPTVRQSQLPDGGRTESGGLEKQPDRQVDDIQAQEKHNPALGRFRRKEIVVLPVD
jgi:hypothetical protein